MRTESYFNVGDIVVLKSGSPRMTVADFSETTGVTCIWFGIKDGNKHYLKNSFSNPDVLKKPDLTISLKDEILDGC